MALLDFFPSGVLSGWTYNDWAYYSALGLAVLVAILSLQAIYNLYLHPLRAYPGPLLNRISPLPWAIALSSGSSPRRAHLLHEKYGPVVRLGPNHLSYVDVRAWKDIYGHRTGAISHRQENAKADIYYNSLGQDTANILNAGREEHAQIRKLLSNGFSDKSMREQEPMITRYVDLLTDRLHQNCGDGKNEIDISHWYEWTTFDVISDLVFAEPFGCLEHSQSHMFIDTITSTVSQGSMVLSLSYLGLRHVTKAVLDMVGNNMLQNLRTAMKEKLKHRLTVKHERFDLLEGLLKQREKGSMDMDKLSANASLIVAAGSETTASLLTGVTYLLLTHPEAMQKLKHEVRSTFASKQEITLTSVNQLSYMLACLNEGLRAFPPAASNLPREVHEGGETIAGGYVPEKTIVECQMYAMNYSSAHWKDANAFKPERFLHKYDTQGNYEESSDPNDDCFEALQPFNVGPRNCIGRNLAYAEMRLILARVIYDFDMALVEKSKGWMDKLKVYTIWSRDPLLINLTPVKRD